MNSIRDISQLHALSQGTAGAVSGAIQLEVLVREVNLSRIHVQYVHTSQYVLD